MVFSYSVDKWKAKAYEVFGISVEETCHEDCFEKDAGLCFRGERAIDPRPYSHGLLLRQLTALVAPIPPRGQYVANICALLPQGVP